MKKIQEMGQKKILIIIAAILLLNVFLRFYQLDQRLSFSWDQISVSWVMKTMFVDHKLPLVGPVAKGNSGFYIGPGYYYFLAPFYWMLQLDPIAEGVSAGIVGLITVCVLMWITWKLFGSNVSLFTGFLYTVSGRVIRFDRVPWNVSITPLASIVIFYCLYQVMMGKSKYLLPLAFAVGFAFQSHFTAIFFPIIIVLTLPFIYKNKDFIKYTFLSIPLFFVWLVPNIISDLGNKSSSSSNMISYVSTYFHGFHLRRVMQLLGDSIVEIESLLPFKNIRFLKYFVLPLFALVAYKILETKKLFVVSYLVVLWFVIPLLVFATYRGELTDYYYSISRPLAPMIAAFIFSYVWNRQQILGKIIVSSYCVVFAYIGISSYFADTYSVMPKERQRALNVMGANQKVEFRDGDPLPYLYGMYWYQKTGTWR